MPNRRLSVRKIKEILRLKLDCGISEREISRSCQVSRSTVADYLRRAAAAKLTWTEASALAETQLEERLFPTEHIPSSVKRPPPDCEHIYNELRTYRKFNLTLSQLWLEYKEKHPDGYQYTQFCEHYWRWRKKLDYCMRQEHRGGEKLFIDYSDGLSIVDTAHRRAYSHPAIPGRLGRFQLYLCRSRAVSNAAGLDRRPPAGASSISAALPGCWCRIISRAASARPASTNRS